MGPDAEDSTTDSWVRMYRDGVSCAGIAQLCEYDNIMTILQAVAEAKARDASLEEDHLSNRLGAASEVQAYAAPSRALRPGWAERLEQLKNFVQEYGRMPRQSGGDPKETALGRWLHAQRGKLGKGALTTRQRGALDMVGDWDSERRAKRDRLSFPDRLRDTVAFRKRQGRWPTYLARLDPDERSLGVWLYTLRQADREGRLPDRTREVLDRHLPGWNP
jgi:hypothetical protein